MATSPRAELISLGIRLVAASALSYFAVRYLVRYMDPSYVSNEKRRKRADVILKRLGIQNKKIELDEHEELIAAQLIDNDVDGVSWDEIGGYESVIERLREEVLLPLAWPDDVARPSLLAVPHGVLLYGPPGCGKTLIAKAIAKSVNARFFNLQIGELTNKWYGESQKLTSAVFSLAQKLQPTVIFIDEIDSFLRVRSTHDHEATAMMKAQFMALWDGFSSDASAAVLVLGATNRPRDVDAAILRRLSLKLEVGLPDERTRAAILRVLLQEHRIDSRLDVDKLASRTNGLSGANLRELCRRALVSRTSLAVKGISNEEGRREAIRQSLQIPLNMDHFVSSLKSLVQNGSGSELQDEEIE